MIDGPYETTTVYPPVIEKDDWRDIGTYQGCPVVLVSRPTDHFVYTPTTAYRDATGVWRVFGSHANATPLRFTPTHWQALPNPPKVKP